MNIPTRNPNVTRMILRHRMSWLWGLTGIPINIKFISQDIELMIWEKIYRPSQTNTQLYTMNKQLPKMTIWSTISKILIKIRLCPPFMAANGQSVSSPPILKPKYLKRSEIINRILKPKNNKSQSTQKNPVPRTIYKIAIWYINT